MSKSPRRPERFEVVVRGEPVGIEVGLDGRVRADGLPIGVVRNTGRLLPRTSRWAAAAGGTEVTGYTAKDAATALAYAVLRAREAIERARERVANLPRPDDPPEDVCPFCRAARDRCDCRPEDFGLDPR